MKKNKENPKYYEDGHKLLGEWKNSKIDKLKSIYEKDRYKARIIYMNDTENYTHFRLMLFKKKNGDFSIVRFRRTYGISKTNKMYSHEKRLHTITYKGKKFWMTFNERGKKYVTHLSLEKLYSLDNETSKAIIKCLADRFSWINHMIDEYVLVSTSFNTIVKEKLFSLKKCLRFQYKMPLGPAKIIHAIYRNGSGYHTAKNLKYYLDYVKNIENLKEGWFNDGQTRSIFHDTLKMAKTLNKQVNCSWTTRRLKEEHDKWATIITDVIFIDGNRKLSINEKYLAFAEQTNYRILKTTKEMAIEGKKNNHCVATYVGKVDRGECAIFSIGDATVEIIKSYNQNKEPLRIGQARGYGNKSVSEDVIDTITKELVKFNKEVIGVECSSEFYENSMGWLFVQPRNAADIPVAQPVDNDNGNWEDLPF